MPDLQCKLSEPLPPETSLDDLIVSFSDLKLEGELGSGQFGAVYAGSI